MRCFYQLQGFVPVLTDDFNHELIRPQEKMHALSSVIGKLHDSLSFLRTKNFPLSQCCLCCVW